MMPGHKRKDCENLQPLLDDYLHGELPRATADRLAVHLDTCGNCRGALDDLRISATLVGAAFEQTEDPSSGFVRLVMARINVAEQWLQEQRSFWRPFEALAWRLTFSAALILAFLFAYGIRISSEAPATPPATVSVQQRDIFTVAAPTAPSSDDEILMAVAEHRHER
ncbi:MAG: zf-HC2 domain-containing protein [Candidatus Acidiferrales bacterium]